jgi:hypothetical protein
MACMCCWLKRSVPIVVLVSRDDDENGASVRSFQTAAVVERRKSHSHVSIRSDYGCASSIEAAHGCVIVSRDR